MKTRDTGQRGDEQTPFDAPSIAPPKGGGSIRGIGEKFAANPVTGTGSFSIPLPVSPGRSGFAPRLSLTYDSGSGNGPFGFGWRLSTPSVTRKTDKGLPRYRDRDESDVYLLSGAEDLVPRLEDDGSFSDDRDRVPGFVIRAYRPRIEGLFARIERWTDEATGNIHWRSISRDNVTTVYGLTEESRISDPEEARRTFAWLICQSYDDKGNAIVYGYVAENDAKVIRSQTNERNRVRGANRYLKSVRYGNTTSRLLQSDLTQQQWLFEVVFDYDEEHRTCLPLDETVPPDGQHRFVSASVTPRQAWEVRPDPFSSYRAGFEVRTYRRCRRVLMFHRFPEPRLVRSLELDYADLPSDAAPAVRLELAHRGSTRFASSIRAVRQCGFVPVTGEPLRYLKKELPPIELDYSRAVIDENIHEIDARELENLPIGIDGARYQWVDLDGEGISGILTEHAGTWRYKPGLGGGRFGPVQTLSTVPSLAVATRRHRLLDLGGDGQLDVVTLDGPTPGFYERTAGGGWEPFRPFVQRANLDFDEPNLRFVDLDGDGHADVLITEDDVFSWREALAEDGFGPARDVRVATDEERGPRLVFADGTQSIYLADMCGDGLIALVRIRNGEICYWPNLGYGRFGAKVTMDNAPRFDVDDLFDQRRVRLADIDGSGASDVIYLGRDAVRLYFNQSGNGWSEALALDRVPAIDDLVSVMTADLLGNGTACLAWSSSRPADAGRPLRYIDLMGGQKPHLLTRVVDNLGTESDVEYASSKKFYLAAKEEGKPWITRIPFPVHVVERVITRDRVSGNRFVTRYEYHHGYFDGEEREFRGFALVEQRDTEELSVLAENGVLAEGTNFDRTSHVPTVLTRTWFHTGTFTARHALASLTGNSIASLVPEGLDASEEHEACRALKGTMLRQDVIGLDVPDRAYSSLEQSFSVERLQRKGRNRHAVFLTTPRESVRAHHERDSAEPRIEHSLTLQVDGFGNVLRSAAIGYGRRPPDAEQPEVELTDVERGAQATTWILAAENEFTSSVDDAENHRTPLPARSRSFHVTGLKLDEEGEVRFRFANVDAAVLGAAPLRYDETPAGGTLQKRCIEDVRTLYRRNDLTGPLPAGQLESLALPHEVYKLAFPKELLALYGERVTDAMLEEGGYVHGDADTDWWMPSGRVFLSPDPSDTPAAELVHARVHFFLPHRFRDPFHTNAQSTETVVAYDPHDLLVRETRDAVGNRTSAEHDYRVLQPSLVTDANGNQVAAAFDALGMVAATAVMGKPGAASGDTVVGIEADLTTQQILDDLRNPLLETHKVLQQATTRAIYDVFAYQRTQGSAAPQPAVVHMLARETHVGDPGGGGTRIQHSFTYADGLGREIQKKARVEDGPLAALVMVAPRWIGSGWTIFDNKGNPVRTYEPFFTDSHQFQARVLNGVAVTSFYDPVGRNVATLHPDHSWEKVRLQSWRRELWDRNDTVDVEDPASDGVAGPFFSRLPAAEHQPTWKQQMLAGTPADRAVAEKTARHAETQVIAHFDALGRAFLTVVRNRSRYSEPTETGGGVDFDQKDRTHIVFDAENNELEVIDALGRVVVHDDFDMLGNRVHTKSIDSGEHWTLQDTAGHPLYAWDSRDQRMHTRYDVLRRPVALLLRQGTDPEVTVGRTVYGDVQPSPRPDPAAVNLLGRVVESDDQAGVATVEAYDFKGNPLRVTRQLVRDPGTIDWSAGPVPLEPVRETTTRYDALNRVIETRTPDNSMVRNSYNEAGLLSGVEANLHGSAAVTTFVGNIDYDEKGRRILIEYGNGVTTSYRYDRLTFRLRDLVTRRDEALFTDDCPQAQPEESPGCGVQSLHYTYDAVGNVMHVRDDAQQTIFFRNKRVEPNASYTYDSLYRLIEATGREHLGLIGGNTGAPVPPDAFNVFHSRPADPRDPQAMGTYLEQYVYDAAGNLRLVRHRRTDPTHPGWTRHYDYDGAATNRLAATVLSGTATAVEPYSYDAGGNMIRMPHLAAHADPAAPNLHWDHRDQLARADLAGSAVAHYTYDGAGQRARKIWKKSAAVLDERIYLGAFETFRTHDGAGNVALSRDTLHITDGAQRIAIVETRTDAGGAQPVIRYQFGNHLGSVSLELDGQARLISYEEYTPYGTTSYQNGDTSKRYRYTAKERDEETGLYYHGARHYAPWLGRWTSCDPGGLIDGLNVYAYVSGNPVNKNDPTGYQGDHVQEQMQGMMFQQLGNEIGAVIEGFLGGSAYVNPAANVVEYSGPEGGVGGVIGGMIRAATLRIVPVENNPSVPSLMGMEAGAALIPVFDPAERLVTGETVTGQPTSREWAAAQFVLDVVPIALEFRAASIEARMMSVAAEGGGTSVSLGFQPGYRASDPGPVGHNVVGVNTGNGTRWSHLTIDDGQFSSGGSFAVGGKAQASLTIPNEKYTLIEVPVSRAEAARAASVMRSRLGEGDVGAYKLGCRDCTTYASEVLNAAGVYTPRISTPFVNAAAVMSQSPRSVGPMRALVVTSGASSVVVRGTFLEERLQMSIPSEHNRSH